MCTSEVNCYESFDNNPIVFAFQGLGADMPRPQKTDRQKDLDSESGLCRQPEFLKG
jgi:hypothetical protein